MFFRGSWFRSFDLGRCFFVFLWLCVFRFWLGWLWELIGLYIVVGLEYRVCCCVGFSGRV